MSVTTFEWFWPAGHRSKNMTSRPFKVHAGNPNWKSPVSYGINHRMTLCGRFIVKDDGTVSVLDRYIEDYCARCFSIAKKR